MTSLCFAGIVCYPAAMDEQAELQKRIDAIVKISSAMFDKSVAYTNVIIIAGYAAFFAVWGNIKSQLSRNEMLYTALFMTISLMCFVIFEIIKMVIVALNLRDARKITFAASLDTFDTKLEELKVAEAKLELSFLPFWIFVLSVTVIFGLLACGILLTAFLRGLLFT